MILSQTPHELVLRFGYLKSISEVRPYLRDYCWAARPGSDVMFRRNEYLMIVFTNGRASETVTCKGEGKLCSDVVCYTCIAEKNDACNQTA